MSERISDTKFLVPAYWAKLQPALAELEAQGYAYIIWETLRSRRRALEMVADKKSKARGGFSMHCLGLACDVVCKLHKWDCHKHGCGFYQAYGAIVEKHGLVWGGNWDRDDRAGEEGEFDLVHNQAIPIGRMQDRVREMPEQHIPTFLESYYAGLVR